MARQPLRGSVWEGPLLSRLSQGGPMALACAMRTPVDPESEIKGTIYGIEGIALGFLRERRPWEDTNVVAEDEAGTSGGGGDGETGT